MKHELRVGVPRVDAIERERVKVRLQLHVARDALHHVHHAAAPARDSLERHSPSIEAEQRVAQEAADAPEQLCVVSEARAQRERKRQHPLPQGYRRQHVLDEMAGCLRHSPAETRGAESPAPTAERHELTLAAVVAAEQREAPRQQATREIPVELVAHERGQLRPLLGERA